MTLAEAAQGIAEAIRAIDAVYWRACDAESRAVDPRELNAPEGLLDESYDAALLVESLADERGISWAEARDMV
jgi:hypothetical protein